MHKTAPKLKFGDFFLNFWLRRPYEDKEIENKTQNMRQLGLGRLLPHSLTRRSSLPSGPGGGFNRFAHSAGPISRDDKAVAFGNENS